MDPTHLDFQSDRSIRSGVKVCLPDPSYRPDRDHNRDHGGHIDLDLVAEYPLTGSLLSRQYNVVPDPRWNRRDGVRWFDRLIQGAPTAGQEATT